jgi:hypothetical protein
MKLRLAVSSAALLCGLVFATSEASARTEHPWCAMIPSFGGGPTPVCLFDTLEQCRQEILGLGGQCSINPYFRGNVLRDDYAPPPRRGSRGRRD